MLYEYIDKKKMFDIIKCVDKINLRYSGGILNFAPHKERHSELNVLVKNAKNAMARIIEKMQHGGWVRVAFLY